MTSENVAQYESAKKNRYLLFIDDKPVGFTRSLPNIFNSITLYDLIDYAAQCILTEYILMHDSRNIKMQSLDPTGYVVNEIELGAKALREFTIKHIDRNDFDYILTFKTEK